MRVLILLLMLVVAPAAAIEPGEMFDDPAKEARAREIGRGLRCLVCQNQSIFDSNAGLAGDLRRVVRERIEAGDSDAEVLEFIRTRYGDYVLLKPPMHGGTAALWLAPGVLLAAGGVAAVLYFRRRRRGGAPAADEVAEGAGLLEEPR